MFLGVALLLGVQQQLQRPVRSDPAGTDTTGYWQQRVHYTIAATLDERNSRIRAHGALRYINNSPDTLRDLYFHQYLNAFRPGSKWSAVDEREGRVRFQNLEEPDFGYERFRAPPRIDGAPIIPEYPGAPDSTVFRLRLPRPLAPHDSVLVSLEWDARPSTVPRRQARAGRHWDLPQWYPKVAVFDRHGWQYNPLQPAGEFYGEFGTYDVTLIVPNDQVLAATGVPISGDPGWQRVIRAGAIRTASGAYGEVGQFALSVDVPAGYKAVRFHARDVHHFAWSASPDYRYEGGAYARRLPATRFQTWDTVSVHVLYRPGDDTTWGGQRALRRTVAALQWLEAVFGAYAYPQLTANHRIDGGGSEMPMLMMNGSPSQGLILHEGGHMYAYGALANNEWREAWMDEGLTSYQTAWAQLLTPLERVRAGIVEQPAEVSGYWARARRMSLPRFEIVALNQTNFDLLSRAQPLATIAHRFRDFDTYNDLVYDRAEVAFSQLRDVLGDSVFVEFLHDYYSRWALRHVDEAAMRGSAQRTSGRDLGWFFDQYLRRTGIMDYELRRVQKRRDASGAWTTEASVNRRGEYQHPVPIGVRTKTGWTFERMKTFPYDRETVLIATTEEPLEVRIDPFHVTWDWDRRNDARGAHLDHRIDWPFLTQSDRENALGLWRPMIAHSRPGGLNLGVRQRITYLGWLDELEAGVMPAFGGNGAQSRYQFWMDVRNPYLRGLRRPAIGWSAGLASFDDVLRAYVLRRREMETLRGARVFDVGATYSLRQGSALLPEMWLANTSAWSADAHARLRVRSGPMDATHTFGELRALSGACNHCTYVKGEVAFGVVAGQSDGNRLGLRAFLAATEGGGRGTIGQRALHLATEDALTTFANHWWRPRGAILKQKNPTWIPLGGAALRGYHWMLTESHVVAMNAELSRRAVRVEDDAIAGDVSMSAFGDAGLNPIGELLADAGIGMKFRGRLFDAPLTLRLDFPIYVKDAGLAFDRRAAVSTIAPRLVISTTDIWP